MGTITARKRKDDGVAFMARVRVMRDGITYHETETFDRCPAATSWIKKRERELAKPGVITAYKAADRLCCANAMKDSPFESSMVAGLHEQTEAPDLPHHELA
jgi:hypothetical protein